MQHTVTPLPATATPLNLHDLEHVARENLPQSAFDYFSSGAWDEITLRESRKAFEQIEVLYRVLVDVSKRDLSVTVFGDKLSMPIFIAPRAFHKLAHPDGELATAKAAGAAGTIMTISTLSNTCVEDIVAAAKGPLWFQLYINKDRGFTRELVAPVEKAGCRALMLTVDTPEWGRRERDVRNGFHLPSGLRAINLLPSNQCGEEIGQSGAGMGQAFSWMIDASVTWKDVDWLCGLTQLPVLLKGICRADDARRSLDHGARGLVVSNQGGPQMDTAPATISVLPRISDAIAGKIPILLDGGVRRGVDVFKALALGGCGASRSAHFVGAGGRRTKGSGAGADADPAGVRFGHGAGGVRECCGGYEGFGAGRSSIRRVELGLRLRLGLTLGFRLRLGCCWRSSG
jgi:4-hydroxymandelate oxidase